MEMRTDKFMIYVFSAIMLGGMVACSSDDPETDTGNGNGNGGNAEAPYVWGAEGAIKTCDHLLFDDDKTENAKGTVIGNGDQEFIFKGTQTLSKGTYLMKGWIYVGTGSVLTIEPGTVIKGDKDTQAALIVEPGGKLIAEGTKDAPIVFTSEQPKGQRKPGDWGGLIICGNAKNNQGVLNQQIEGGPRTKHGGNDDADNSGILRYVRVEFAGYPFQKDKEINGITFSPSPRFNDIISPTDLDNPALSRNAFVIAISFVDLGNSPSKSGYFANFISVSSIERTVNL